MPSFLLAIALLTPFAVQDPPPASQPRPQDGPAVVATQAPEAGAEGPRKPGVSVGADVLASSAFVWRGFVDGDSMVVQPDVWIRIGGMTVSSWMNVARHTPENTPLTEHDLTADYSFSRGRFTVSAGWINYAFLDQDSGRISNEFYAGVARQGPLSPSLRVYQDVQQGSGTYAAVSVQQPIALFRGLEVAPSASVGYNRHLYTPYSAFSDAGLGLRATIPTPVKGLTLQPFVAYSFSLDHRITTDRFYWGVGAGIASR